MELLPSQWPALDAATQAAVPRFLQATLVTRWQHLPRFVALKILDVLLQCAQVGSDAAVGVGEVVAFATALTEQACAPEGRPDSALLGLIILRSALELWAEPSPARLKVLSDRAARLQLGLRYARGWWLWVAVDCRVVPSLGVFL